MIRKNIVLFWALLWGWGIGAPTTHAQWLPAFGRSRVGTAGFQFLKIHPDARSAALSGNAINLVNEPSVMFWNPAGLVHGEDRTWSVQASHLSYWSGIRMQSLAMARRWSGGEVL
ncbi:MAG: hypothetical protein ACKO17_01145, partial [Bacteroidota bacterium]